MRAPVFLENALAESAGPIRCPHFIAGRWHEAKAKSWFDVTNSSTGEVVAHTPLSGAGDVELAVSAAASAFPEWSQRPVSARMQVLFQYKALLETRGDEIARRIAVENGKTFQEARAELQRGLGSVELACGMPMMIKGQTLDNLNGIDYQTARSPLGVCAGVGAFNFPFLIPHWMFPMAI
ncbi:MAG: aldehyde dehydrogenase family protein, partial [Candidatus Hydrogenedentes bacterium]|nr:aldehyde dehydrogenase family protein [Candidatus Hydrogenedentota bacterium]